jgi:hypothetical protein
MYNSLSYVCGGIFGRPDVIYHSLIDCIYIRRCFVLQASCTLYKPAENHNEINNQPFHQFYSPST